MSLQGKYELIFKYTTNPRYNGPGYSLFGCNGQNLAV
jgi:hypothetical protein